MKFLKNVNLYFILVLFLFQSCYKDNSTTPNELSPKLSISGVSETITVDRKGGLLKFNPILTGDVADNYSFAWLLYDATFINNNPKLPIADTLSKTLNLDYTVNNKKSGEYLLVLRSTNNKTNIEQFFKYKLIITTANLSGWYILKEQDGQSDLDFYFKGGKVENWIAANNQGKSLVGKAKKVLWVPRMKNTIQSPDLYSGLAVVTDQDVVIFKIEDATKLMDYETMFFSKPSNKRIQNLLLGMNGNLLMINDGRYYIMTAGSKFGSIQASNYEIGDVSVAAAMDIFFDTKTKTVFLNDANSGIRTLLDNGKDLKNMSTDLFWAEANRGSRSTVNLIFKDNKGEGLFFKLNAQYGPFISTSQPLIAQKSVLPIGHHLLTADVINSNYDNDILYFGKDNKVYYSAFTDLGAVLQKTFEAGEQITCIQHIKYPAPNSGVINTFNKVAVATFNNGNYTVWIADISSTGELVFKPSPDFEGKGKVNSFSYLENDYGNFIYR